jgi:uncharacterized membrane protein
MPELTRAQKASDQITEFCGSWLFIEVFSGITTGWIVLNTALVWFGEFDPYPFVFFNLILTVVSTFQGPLIMMSQNRQIERDREAIYGLHQKLDQQDALIQDLHTKIDRLLNKPRGYCLLEPLA